MHAHADMPRNPYLTVKTVILVGLLWICHDDLWVPASTTRMSGRWLRPLRGGEYVCFRRS